MGWMRWTGVVAMTVLPVQAATAAAPSPAEPVLAVADTAGAAALRAGDMDAALAALTAARRVTDSAFHQFKLGVALAGTGAHAKAIASFQQAAQRCSLLAPCAYEQIARAEIAQQRTHNAIAAYRSALGCRLPKRYQVELQNAVAGIVATSDVDSSEIAWLGPWFAPAPLVVDTVQQEVVARLVADRNWAALDSVLAVSLRAGSRREACRLFALVPLDSVPVNALPTARLFDGASTLHACGQARLARQWLARTESRPDYITAVDPRRVLYLRGMLAYAVGDLTRAIDVLREYERTYGPTSEVVLALARAYRSQGRSGRSGEWYDRHIQLYPRHAQSQELLWYRAWQHEEDGQLETAITLYRRIRQQFRSGARAPESCFREGLLHFREGRHDSALAVWGRLQKSFPQSSAANMACYWQARSYLARGRIEDARKALVSVVQYDPLGYYSYRAQDLLRGIGDTVTYLSFDTAAAVPACRRWLDSLTQPDQRALAAEDSLAYRTGMMLLAAGLEQQGHYYLEPLLLRYPSNLTMQYDLAGIYDTYGHPGLAHRAARPLAWRIPPEARMLMPRGVLAMVYPDAFAAEVSREAARHGVAPDLVFGLIRQESVFDPAIVSPAGAVGLMQLMPATAEAVTRQLGEPYVKDSLYSPAANVRYGVYYLRELLDRFGGSAVLALAGYNGGPDNSRNWYERNKALGFDLFVESISFTETRGYVKRVLANYWTYSRLNRDPVSRRDGPCSLR